MMENNNTYLITISNEDNHDSISYYVSAESISAAYDEGVLQAEEVFLKSECCISVQQVMNVQSSFWKA